MKWDEVVTHGVPQQLMVFHEELLMEFSLTTFVDRTEEERFYDGVNIATKAWNADTADEQATRCVLEGKTEFITSCVSKKLLLLRQLQPLFWF